MTAAEFQARLLSEHRMYVRDCSNKVGMDKFHIRVASQGREKDAQLVDSARDIAPMKRPSVLVVTRRTHPQEQVHRLRGRISSCPADPAGILPVMVPVVEGAPACLPEYMADMQGLLLVEGEDIEPGHYKACRENVEVRREDASAEG